MQKKSVRRLKFLYLLITLFLILVVARLYQYQIVDWDAIKLQSDSKINRRISLPAKRGEIRDRNGALLAYSLETYDVYLHKHQMAISDDSLHEIIKAYPDASKTDMMDRINKATTDSVLIIEGLPFNYVQNIRNLATSDVEVVSKMTRVYPNGSLASHVLGFTNIDGKGIEGVEFSKDDLLTGKAGYIETRTDERGRKLAYADANEVPPIDGQTVYLTIDRTIQYYTEQAIRDGYEFNEAKRVMAIVQDAKTGEILAMATAPDYDPNKPRSFIDKGFEEAYTLAQTDQERMEALYAQWRNPIVSDLYEPGSTFKIFTGLVGLEENVVSRYDEFYCSGFLTVLNHKVRCWIFPRSHERETFEEGFQDSCNVVFMKVIEKIKRDVFYRYLNTFGLLTKSSIELNSATPISRPERQATALDMANISFGHAISVTPLHVMNILQVVSNNGVLTEPSIISRVLSADGIHEEVPTRFVKGQLISEGTAKEMREILTTVITEGSGKRAYIPGYDIGGKTGTAIKNIAGGYEDERRVYSSFAAIVPSDQPVFNVLVIVDEPKNEVFGSLVAAPIAKEIIYNTLEHLEIPSSSVTGQDIVVIPNFVGLSIKDALSLANERGLKLFDVDEEDGIVRTSATLITKQYPLEGSLSSRDNVVFLSKKKTQ